MLLLLLLLKSKEILPYAVKMESVPRLFTGDSYHKLTTTPTHGFNLFSEKIPRQNDFS